MTQETTQPQITIDATDNDKVQKFVSQNKAYLQGEIYRSGKDYAIDVKPTFVGDSDKLKEIRKAAQDFGGVLHYSPKVHVLFPNAPMSILEGYSLHFRKREDFEWGGPQPRIWVLDDPELVALANNIELNGQREPVDASPSPTGSGKLWLIEGHGRFTSIFEILAKRDPQRWTGIWTKEKKRSRLECYEDSVILNGKKNLSAYELGSFIMKLKQDFPDIYASGKHGFSFQETVAKRLGFTHQRISQILIAFTDVQTHTAQLPEAKCNSVAKLPEGIIREIRKAPEEAKPAIYEATVDAQLQTPDVKAIIETVKEKPEMTKEEIEAEAERIKKQREEDAKARVEKLTQADEKFEKKLERNLDKVVEANSHFPEDLMTVVFGHLSPQDKKSKVSVEEAEEYAKIVVALMLERTSQEDLEKILAEADCIAKESN